MPAWKGKQKARADDQGGTQDGYVIPLELVGSGIYDATYTVPVTIGQNDQKFSLQVDTGSSDLWVASTSCSSTSCGQTNNKLYDPSQSGKETGVDFSIQYLSGSVDGPVYWDRVVVGGYSIEYQALAAATDVENEALAPDFNGLLGLALPLNSIIAENIPPVTNNSPDGAAWASNLFSITPTINAPSSRFLSLSLSRPGSNRIPSYLGIGKHPPDLVDDVTKIHYANVISNPSGSLFWKTGVRDITVWVDGQPRRVDIGRSNTGAVFPSAVVDSGVPYIFTTSKVANAIYGAIDVHPARDGNYYVPCQTPLNMTISLDDRPEPFALHPLDITAEPAKDNNAEFCVGLIQAADNALAHPSTGIGDIILGVPFMRNVYTVMAYTIPEPDGSFEPVNDSEPGMQPVRPRLGLMSLTEPGKALDEFNTVRVLNQPLSTDDGSLSHASSSGGGKKLSVGIIVLIALLGFFALCCGLFLIRWLLYRKRYKQARERDRREGMTDDKRALAYQLARRGSGELTGMPSEDTLRAMRYEAYLKKEQSTSFSTRSQSRSWGTAPGGGVIVDEFGVRGGGEEQYQHDYQWNDDTLVAVGTGAGTGIATGGAPILPPPESRTSASRHSRSSSSPERLRGHQRTPSELPDAHQRTTSIATPLLDDHGGERHSDEHEENTQPYRDRQ